MNHEYYMHRCLELAAKGQGLVAPNPMVGCVVVHQDQIIAEGFHHRYGGPHAEVEAFDKIENEDVIPDSIVYVNLEPCSHHGKTPPCAELLIRKGVKKVVIAALDPNPLVAGNGVKLLHEAGIEVIIGICEREALYLNRIFYTYHQKKRTYITLKWAETADGFIGKKPTDIDFEEKKVISGEHAHRMAHQLRAQSQAILIGGETARNDNPSLTTRLWPGRNPMRVIYSPSGNLPSHLKVFDETVSTILVTDISNDSKKYIVPVFKIDTQNRPASQIAQILYNEYNLQHLLVEGGTRMIETFYQEHLFDEIYNIKSKSKVYITGIEAPSIKETFILSNQNEEDLIYHFQNI